MWKKLKLVLLSSALAISITGATNFTVLADDNTNNEITEPVVNYAVPTVTENIDQNYVKVIFDNKVLFHEQVPTTTMIQVLNSRDEVLKSEVLSSDIELELEMPNIEKNRLLSYWTFDNSNGKLQIKPVIIVEQELVVTFEAHEGGQLLENNAQTKDIVKSVNSGAKLKDILPEVNPKDNYKFTGWFIHHSTEENGRKVEIPLKNVDDIKIKNDSLGEYNAKFYPDFNNNNIDDRTEDITIKFVTNSNQKYNDINTKVGFEMKLPTLKKNGSIFMGWYTDEEYKNKFTGEIFTESLTLYAQWEKTEKVVAESGQKPITDKNISDQIERALKNSANQMPSTPPSSSGLTVQPSIQQGNTGNTFKETIYVFENLNLGEIYMVKFFDEEGGFLFSHTFPYGKTIKTYDENEKVRGEFAVRQDTTITLNTKDYINKDSLLLGFKSREVKVNSMQITEVYPDVKFIENKDLALENAKAMEEEYLAAKKKSNTIFTSLTLLLVSVAGISIFLFMKRMKRSRERNHEQV